MNTQLEICAAVMADSQRFEFIFLQLDSPVDSARVARAVTQGRRYVGTLLYKNGQTSARLNEENPVCFDVLTLAIQAFAEVVCTRIELQSQSWLEKLYSVPDMRNGAN